MKNLSLLIILLLPNFVFSQVVNHFSNQDSRWNVAKTYPNATEEFPNFVETTTTVFGFEGDTLIEGQSWFKLYSTLDSMFVNDLNFEAYLRTENNVVLQRNSQLELDTLYEFNLVVGDSILYDFFGEQEYLSIIDVDSIDIQNQYYERYHFSEPTIPNGFTLLNEKWIEGIGSIHGPMFPNYPTPFSTEIPDSLILICTESQETPLFQHSSYDDCVINIVLDISSTEWQELSIFPNPFDQKITIQTEFDNFFAFSIYNVFGQLVHQGNLGFGQNEIDLSRVKSGTYILKLESKGDVFSTRLFKR